MCFISFVRLRQRAGASWPPAFWEKLYSEARTPPASAITPYITLLQTPPPCVCLCGNVPAGPSAFAESGKTGGTTRRREIAGLNQQTAKPHVCVCVCVRQRLRMNEIAFPKTLYSYWL